MQFNAAPKPQSLWQRFSGQPHRLFFGSSIFWGIVLMGLSMASFLGVRSIDFMAVHGYGLLYGLFFNAFLGFLSTVIPRYTQSYEIARKTYLAYWLIYQTGLLTYIAGGESIGKMLDAAALMYAGFVYFQTIRKGGYPGEPDSLWLTGLVFAGGIVLLASLVWDIDLPWTGAWLSILPITFTVAQRMIPFFYAGYFQSFYNKPAWVVPVFVPLAWGIGLSGASSSLTALLSAALTLAVAYFLATLDIYRKSPPILWILRLGLLWLPVGLIAVAFEALYSGYTLKAGLHILLIGFVLTLLVGFGTRVLLGHSGQRIIADKTTLILFGAVQTLALIRLAASLLFMGSISAFTGMLHLGFALFVLLMIVWGIRYRKEVF